VIKAASRNFSQRAGQLPECPGFYRVTTRVFHMKSLVVFPRAHQSWLEAEPLRQIERTMDGTGTVVFEASSENCGVSIWSEAHPPRSDDKPSRHEKVFPSRRHTSPCGA
jgi:hypothetical protein